MSEHRERRDADQDEIQRAIERLLREQHVTRRAFLRRAVYGGAALSIPALLAACGIPAATPAPPTPGASPTAVGASPTASPSPTPRPSPSGQLAFANWPLYIDTDEEDESKHKTLDDFTKATGIKVEYSETIQDNEEFFGTIQPDLAAGNPTDWDLIVVTDWMIAKMIRLGYLEEIDVQRDVPNFVKNAHQVYKDPAYDPGNRHSVPWQAGITGIGYNVKMTGREITSFDDLLDPRFRGRVGMFSEMRDTMSLTLLSLGIKPENATVDDARRAQQKLLEAARRGQFRQFYGNEYTDELANGNLAISMGWSGDVYQLALYDNPDLRFVIPREGGVRWVDNMAIPKNARHPVDATMMMDFVYRPEIATQIAEYIGYFTPVASVPQLVLRDSKAAADEGDREWSEQLKVIARTVQPTQEQLAQTSTYKVLDEDEERQWNELFNEVIQG